MDVSYEIGPYYGNEMPSLDQVSHCFLDYSRDKWHENEGMIRLYGVGSANNAGGSGVDISLGIFDVPSGKFYLIYSVSSEDTWELYHSCDCRDALGEGKAMVEIDDNGYQVSEALLISAVDAWKVVRYFVESIGKRSDAIEWISEIELPESTVYSPCE